MGDDLSRPASVVFVVACPGSDLQSIARLVADFGLWTVPDAGRDTRGPAGDLSRFNDTLLADLDASRTAPAMVPHLELWRKLEHRADEARRVFAAASEVAAAPQDGQPIFWVDSRNMMLAPFWKKVLGAEVSVVLVHRHPADVAAELSGDGLSSEDALAVWDEYNRMGMSLWHDLSGIIVARDDVTGPGAPGLERLLGFLDRMGCKPDEAAVAAARAGAGSTGPDPAEDPDRGVPSRFLVLHRVLAGADSEGAVEPSAVVNEVANYYDQDYYEDYGNPGDAPYLPGEPQWVDFFAMVAGRIVEDLAPRTVLDAGCAIGFLVDALRQRGVEAWGVDVSEWAIAHVPDSVRDYCSVASLTEELEGQFDLVTMIEVIEHLPDSVADQVVGNLARHAGAVLFSSTSTGFEEATHINVRTPDHWADLFASHGFFRDFGYSVDYISKDAILFRRSAPGVNELVIGYEQALWTTREHLQGILDDVVPERDALLRGTADHAEPTTHLGNNLGELEQELEGARSRLADLERRRSAEMHATQVELLRREHETTGLHQALNAARLAATANSAEIERIEATKVFRYSSGLRRLYGRVRRRSVRAGSSATDEVESRPEHPKLSFDEWAATYDVLGDADRKALRLRCNAIADPPLISVILPVYNTPPQYLREAIDSVRSQLYPHWELCIADDASTDPQVLAIADGYATEDSRITVVRRTENGHISAASNSALGISTGRWVALLDHDDRLREEALALMAIAADEHPSAGLLYSDESIVDAEGNRLSAYFKPDFDPLLLLGMNHVCHLAVLRADLVEEVGGFREGLEGSQDWDLLLRVSELLDRDQVVHVRHLLYDWRSHPASTAQSLAAKPYAANSGLRAVVDHLERTHQDATVATIPALGWNRVRWPLPDEPPLVSIIVPTRDGKWLERCLTSVWGLTTYPNYEVVVVDNGSASHKTLAFLQVNEGRLTVIRDDRAFNYSRLNNEAVARARGSIVCLLNDDTEVITPDWLDEMVAQVLRPGVGAVGAKLYYDNGTVQHAGVVLGIGGVAGHVHRGLDRLEIGYFGRAVCVQQLSAVTGACMVVRREAWEQVSGLNETDLAIGYNDVDFCLRLGEAGWTVTWTPYAELYHHESLTRGSDVEGANAERLSAEGRYMHEIWGMRLREDRAYNPNLTLVYEDFSLAFPPRIGRVEP